MNVECVASAPSDPGVLGQYGHAAEVTRPSGKLHHIDDARDGFGTAGIEALDLAAEAWWMSRHGHEFLGTTNLDHGVQRRRDGEIREIGRDVVGGDRLHQCGRQANGVALRAPLDDAADELEKLGRTEDGVRNPRALDQVLLRHLRLKITAVGKSVGPDNRKRDMMLQPSRGFRREKIAARRLKELHHGLVLERRGVRHVHDDLGVRERFRQPLASDGVDARVRGSGHDLMAALTQSVNDVRADKAAAANDDDFHRLFLDLFPTRQARSMCGY